MLGEFTDWLEDLLPGYVMVTGAWQDDPTMAASSFAAVRQNPAGSPVVGVRRARFHVTLLGPRNGRQNQLAIMADAAELAGKAITRATVPCGAAHIVSMGEAQGPGLTTENRPWASLDFELIF